MSSTQPTSKGGRPTRHLVAIDGGGEVPDPRAKLEAWTIIVGAFDQAFAVRGLDAKTTGQLQKARAWCCQCLYLAQEAVAE